MPPRKQRNPSMQSTAPEPYPINPVCAANIATITANLLQVTKSLERVKETVFGNGKIGLDEQTKENTRIIQDILTTMKTITTAHAEESRLHTQKLEEQAAALERTNKERRTNILQWRIAIAIAIITALSAVATAIIGSDQIMALILKTH
jgi:hypothetical protein